MQISTLFSLGVLLVTILLPPRQKGAILAMMAIFWSTVTMAKSFNWQAGWDAGFFLMENMVGLPPVVNRRDVVLKTWTHHCPAICCHSFTVSLWSVSDFANAFAFVLVWRISKQMPCQGHVIWIALLTPSPRTHITLCLGCYFFIRRCSGSLKESLIFLEDLTKSDVISSQQPPD